MLPNLHTVLTGLDSLVAGVQRQALRTLGRTETVRVIPYRGWVTPSKAVVLGRTVLTDLAIERQLERSPRLVRMAYERFGTLETRALPVHVRWQEQSVTTASDAGGFIDTSFPVHGQAPAHTTHAELTVQNAAGGAAAAVDVFALHPRAAFGIISDIDDTVLETELTNPWKRGLQLMYSEQRMRLPFVGIAALYQAFAQLNNPIFYVSNAPWNLYSHVAELLDHHQIPKGPLLLRDSRFAERIVPDTPGGALLVHKQRALRRIVEDHPGVPFVLLGDSSRRDPMRYLEVAEAYPGRVAAIYIRQVRGVLARRGSLDQLKERAQRAGVDWLLADDTVSIAKHAQSRGFVPPGEVGRVRERKLEDEQAPPAELTRLSASASEAAPATEKGSSS